MSDERQDEGQEEKVAPEQPEPEPADEQPAARATAQPQATVPPRLMRRREGKVIAGVCTGLGAYTGTDPVIWRIGFVVLGLTTGIGIIGYIVAWLVMPQARHDEPLPTYHESLNLGRWVGVGAIILGALVVFRNILGIHGGVFWGLLLIGIGLAIWGRDLTGGPRATSPRTPYTPPPPSTPTQPIVPPSPPPTWGRSESGEQTESLGTASTSSASLTQTTPAGPSPRHPRDRGPRDHPVREPSILGRLVVGAAALAIGITLLLSNLDVVSISPRGAFAVLLAIVGAGLLIGTWWGRARWLIIPGAILALNLATVSVIPFNTRGGFGEANWRPTSLATVRNNYEHTAGPLLLDLSRVKFGRHSRTINVRLGFGPMLVIVPKDVDVVVDGHVQGGPLDLFGHESEGWDVSDTVVSKGEPSKAAKKTGAHLATLRLRARVTFGPLSVQRAGSPEATMEMLDHSAPGTRRHFRPRFGG